MPASGVRAAEGGGSKESPKRDVVISSLRYLIGGCARGAELTAMAPLNLPNKWARILRMSSAPKIQIDDFLQVMPGGGRAGAGGAVHNWKLATTSDEGHKF